MDLWVSGLHASGIKILLMLAVVQSLNLVVFAWFNRVAEMRMLVLRQQLTVYKRRSKKPMLKNRDRLFWSLLPLGGRLVAIPALNGLHHDYRMAAQLLSDHVLIQGL